MPLSDLPRYPLTFGPSPVHPQDRRRRVIGIDASAKLEETRAQVAKIARNTAELIGLGRDLHEDEINVLAGWASGNSGRDRGAGPRLDGRRARSRMFADLVLRVS